MAIRKRTMAIDPKTLLTAVNGIMKNGKIDDLKNQEATENHQPAMEHQHRTTINPQEMKIIMNVK